MDEKDAVNKDEQQKEEFEGIVCWFQADIGYGFVTPKNGEKDLFVHYSNIISDSPQKNLRKDDEVSYTLGENKKGPQCENVKVIKSVKTLE